jgi:3-deoxy-manno-octulosonate cytidylyltransferase (CMP-KDO synthetase)
MSIAGKPMILHVCDRALEAKAEEVVVATDDQRIYQTVIAAGINAVMTRADHNNGTERLAEVAKICAWKPSDIVVNLQGDEPLVPASVIRDLAIGIAAQTLANVATLATPISQVAEVFNSNIVKVVMDQQGCALYFSRAPVPWDRDRFEQGSVIDDIGQWYMRHIGLYAYSVGFLNRYTEWKPCDLESVELLEQLRILWHGEKIKVIKIDQALEPGVDTEDDLKRVESRIRASLTDC